MSGRSFSDSVCRSSTISALEIVLCLLIQTLVSRLLKASLSVIEFYSPPPFFPAGLSFGVKNSFGARRNRGSDGLLQTQTIQWREHNPIVDGHEGWDHWISASSKESSPLSFTIIGLSLGTLYVMFTALWALRKEGGAVRPVLPTDIFALKTWAALRRTYHENNLFLGLSIRRFCRKISDCRSSLKVQFQGTFQLIRSDRGPTRGSALECGGSHAVLWCISAF